MYVDIGTITIKFRDNERVILRWSKWGGSEWEKEKTKRLEIVAEWSMYELERRMNERSSLADFLFPFYQSRKMSIKSPRGRGIAKRFTYTNEIWERALRVGRSMPALVLRNGSEIEIYGAGSAVSPINDRVVYSEGTVGLFILDTRARREEGTSITWQNCERRKDIKQCRRDRNMIIV